ncbi:MAG: prepilin-type N-terminal cleavage/methylation domain-containing protein [bacterium]
MKRNGGFTLVELLIVVAVIGILSGVVITVLNPDTFRDKSQDARRKTDLTAIQSSLELYFADNNAYPVRTAGEGVDVSGLTELTTGGYLSVIPNDPDGGTAVYYYKSDASGLDYELNANLESDTAGEANDGGNDNTRYEVGTNLILIDPAAEEA